MKCWVALNLAPSRPILNILRDMQDRSFSNKLNSHKLSLAGE